MSNLLCKKKSSGLCVLLQIRFTNPHLSATPLYRQQTNLTQDSKPLSNKKEELEYGENG
jgi:hypothetical protein